MSKISDKSKRAVEIKKIGWNGVRKSQLFKSVYDEYCHKVYRLCCTFCRAEDDRRDLMQNIFLNVWKNLRSFEGRSHISTWIYRIAMNTAITFAQKNRREQNRFTQLNETAFEYSDPAPSAADSLEVRQTTEILFDAIRQLNETDRIIISLYLEEEPRREIAAVTGLTEKHVGVKIYRIKEKLAQLLKGGPDEY